MRRRLELPLLAMLLVAGSAHAADYTMAKGVVHFNVPDNWPRIMQVQGDPEMMAFQVPDSSPTGETTLARITVTSKLVSDITGYKEYVAARMADAHNEPSFHLDKARSGATWIQYTATESEQPQTYVERYYFKDGYAVQLRCVRPTHSKAGQAWTYAFDNGCNAIANELK